jgi:adenylate cyclase
MPNADRRLAAIMFTDVVGYTRMSQAKESLALELLEEHRKVVRPVLAKHGGTEVKTIGDAFLVEFKSALEAVLCAVEIQSMLTGRNSGVPTERRLEVRIGIHLGDVVHETNDVYGDAVNVASRIEQLSPPGGVCISQQVYESIRNKSDLGFVEMGEVELKNVEFPMRVYRVDMESIPSGSRSTKAPRERLAVLPFVNISPDPNDEYFADGLTEELITMLSEVRGLKVIARTSVMNYKKKEKNVSQIGRELEVGSIIEGSVRKAGNKIRVTVQLIDSRTEEHLWASNYDSQLDDIFAIQTDVARKVAKSVSSGVLVGEWKKDTDDVEAYTMYIKAVQLCHAGTERDLREAVSLLERATSKDPGFARAYAWLATAWNLLASGGYEGWEIVGEKVEALARKGLELGPEWAETHAAMANVNGGMDRFSEAISEAERAIQINPNLSEAYHVLGIQYSALGDLGKGISAFEKGHELDPLAFYTANALALAYRVGGRVPDAIRVLERMKGLGPMNPRVYASLADCYLFVQDYEKAQEMIDAGDRLGGNEVLLKLEQGLLYAFTDRKADAEAILAEIAAYKLETPRIYLQLFLQSALGNLDECFKVLERMAELHSWPFLIGTLPVFADMRKDPRYAVFAAKVGLAG